MINARDFAMNLISQNPQVMGNPKAQQYLALIQSGDSKQIEQVAKNLCETYGVTPQQAIQQAKGFFNIPF